MNHLLSLTIASLLLVLLGSTGCAEKNELKMLRAKAERGSPTAQYTLGLMYLNGQGVVKDHEPAVSHFRKAAGHGEAGAQFNLALAYARGQGADWDLIEAHKWAILAADQGLIDAGKPRDSVVLQLSLQEMDESYRRASETLRAIERRRKVSGRS